MKYSLRKSFSYRRRTDLHDDDHVNPRIENQIATNSNSNLVKTNQSKSFLRRHRRRYSSSPPPSASPDRIKSKTFQLPYNNHVNDEDDDDDDPFSSSTNANTRVRPFDKLTNQIRKSFRNTLTRRSRLESTNSNKRLITNKNDENHVNTKLSTSLTSPIISLGNTNSSKETEKDKAPPKRRKAPLAPNHMNQSMSVPNTECASLRISDLQESGYVSSSNDQQQDLFNKKTKLNRSFRTRISLLLKKRHAKQQQQQHQEQQKHQPTQNSIDEEVDHQPHDDQDENINKKQTLSQRFDTIRRSFHLGSRNSTSKGKRHLLSNE